MKEMTPIIASILGGLLVWILGLVKAKFDTRKVEEAAIKVKELDNTAKLAAELLDENRKERNEIALLHTQVLSLKLALMDLENEMKQVNKEGREPIQDKKLGEGKK